MKEALIVISLLGLLYGIGSTLMPFIFPRKRREYTREERGSNTFIDSDGKLKSLDDHEVGVSK